MHIKIIAIGKLKKDYIKKGVADYTRRIIHYIPFEIIEIKEPNLEKFLNRDSFNILLDEKGKQFSSIEFAEFIEKRINFYAKDIVFFIGSAEGFSEKTKEKANLLLSLSKMTIPHELTRMLLVEQIYRAFTIIRGEQYHK